MDYAKPFAKVGKATFTVTLKDTEYSKTFEVSVKAADKTALNNAIAAAEKLTEDKCLCSMVLRPVERLVFSPKER